LEKSMKRAALALAVAVAASGIGAAHAALRESDFPPKTVRDLITICAPTQDDPMLTAAINYCHGYAEGAVVVESAHASQHRGRKLFCLPNPPPGSGTELGKFVTWANQEPSRLDEPAVDGMFLYLAEKYPCRKKM
jgi:Rap1a immunity proteins